MVHRVPALLVQAVEAFGCVLLRNKNMINFLLRGHWVIHGLPESPSGLKSAPSSQFSRYVEFLIHGMPESR